jgi:pyruvate dehydrogenase E1 component beta subunit
MAVKVADELECSDGISVEVVDPRALVPLDWPLVSSSIKKTGALVVADPGRRTCGAGSELVSRAVEDCWRDLRVAPRRVTCADFPIPYSPVLEREVTVQPDDLRESIRDAAQEGYSTTAERKERV